MGKKLVHITFVLAIVFMAAALSFPACAQTQERTNSVEINLDVLGGAKKQPARQSTKSRGRSIPESVQRPFLTAPQRIQKPVGFSPIAPSVLLPLPVLDTAVPRPARKPFVDRKIKQPTQRLVQKVEKQREIKDVSSQQAAVPSAAKPPIPPRRPSKINAPESFIREARQKHQIESMKAVKPVSVEKELLPPEIAEDPLGRHIVEQTSRDVLASIDPSASLPPASQGLITAGEPNVTSLGYRPSITALPLKIQSILEERVLKPLQVSAETRMDVTAYASVVAEEKNSDRRIALDRALAVRDFFVGKGVAPARIHIRALGNQTDRQPVDRVDITLIHPEAP